MWIAEHPNEITLLRDQLIAALFFFNPTGSPEHGVRGGEILCRLPVNLEARQQLINAMLAESDSNFVAEYDGVKRCEDINTKQSLSNIHPGDELRIQVNLPKLPHGSKVLVHIKMPEFRGTPS